MQTGGPWIILSIIVTWAILLLGVGINWGVNREQIRTINKWIEGHEAYSREQDITIVKMRETIVELVTLNKTANQRLDLFEKAMLVLIKGKSD